MLRRYRSLPWLLAVALLVAPVAALSMPKGLQRSRLTQARRIVVVCHLAPTLDAMATSAARIRLSSLFHEEETKSGHRAGRSQLGLNLFSVDCDRSGTLGRLVAADRTEHCVCGALRGAGAAPLRC